MKKVLILIPYYFPGFRAGGPQQTIKNVVDTFGNQADFYIYTQNHDLNREEEYENLEFNQWIKKENANIMYTPANEYCGRRMELLYKEFDIIYSCGLFERNSISILRIHKRLHDTNKKVYIAPMGVFSDGAIHSKFYKKKLFLTVFKKFGLFDNVIWSVTSDLELKDAIKYLKESIIDNYIVAEDLPRKMDFEKQIQNIKKENLKEKTLKVIFLSRICSKKNLLYCAEILNRDYEKNIVFDIYGTIEDEVYWNICKKKFEELPERVNVKYCGEVRPDHVVDTFSKYDVFLFPTKGENFGHVIYEALAAGCIPVIADTTPWMELDSKQCGKVNPYGDTNEFQSSIEEIVELKDTDLIEKKKNAVKYAEEKYEGAFENSGYAQILR